MGGRAVDQGRLEAQREAREVGGQASLLRIAHAVEQGCLARAKRLEAG